VEGSSLSDRLAREQSWLVAEWRHLMEGWQRSAAARTVPRELRARLAFERGERVLALAHDPGGERALVATDRALCYRADRTDGDDWLRLGWERVIAANWARADGGVLEEGGADGRLVVAILSGSDPAAGSGHYRVVIPVRRRGTVPEVAAERVTHARLGRWPVPLPDGSVALIEVRRRPVTGVLLWAVFMDGTGPGPDDHHVRARIEAAIGRLRADLGLAPVPDDTGPEDDAPAETRLRQETGLRQPDSGPPPAVVPRPRAEADLPRAGVGTNP
jgi:hypothetical protein